MCRRLASIATRVPAFFWGPSRIHCTAFAGLAICTVGSDLHTNAQETALRFTDMSKACGIQFQHDDGSTGSYHIIEAMSAGLALFDYDNDGDIDIYLLNGSRLEETRAMRPRNCLFRNDGNWQFTDVTDIAGVGDTAASLGVAVGDYDNDGDSDIYVNNYGPNVLYQNKGDGTFASVGEHSGVTNGNRVGAGV